MATKNYLDYTGLTTYDGLIKDYIGDNTGDSKNVTWEEYSQLPESEKKNSNIAYYITGVPDEESKKGYLGTASGELCTFTDGSDLPMPKLEVAIEPVQDLHGYDAPWVGGAGKNKLPNSSVDSKSVNGLQINNDKNGKYTISGTATANTFIDFDLDDSYVIKSGDYLHFMNSATNSGASFTLMDGSTLGFSAVFSSTNRIADLSNYVGSTVNKIRFYFAANQGMTGTMTPMIVNSNIATTFAPYSNICPIIGWDEVNVRVSGVNVWDEEWELGTINDTTGQDAPENGIIRSKGYIAVKSGIQYYIKKPTNSDIYQIFLYRSDKTFMYAVLVSNIINRVYAIPSGCSFIRFRCLTAYGTTYNNDISINYPSTDTDYHAYNGATYTIDLDGTRYGGKLDLVSGVLTVDRVAKDLGELTYSYTNNIFVSQLGIDYKYIIDTPSKCSCYKYVGTIQSGTSDMTNKDDSTYALYRNTNYPDVRNIYIKDSRYTDETVFKNAINGQKVLCELATPLTIQLTPTVVKSLRGVNNVTTDVGGLIQLEYWRSGNVQLRMNDYVIAGGNTVAYADVAENIIQTPINTDNEYRILFSGSDDNTTKADSVGKNGGLLYNPNKNAITLGTRVSSSVTGGGSFVLGGNNTASGNGSFIHGVGCTASGNVSHAIGAGSVASGNVSFAQGSGVTASGDISHAEGTNTEASNDNAHAEGYHSLASGPVSHAEGSHTVASGNISHAEGIGTIAQRAFNHVFGKYNVADTGGASTTGTGTYIEIVGNGTDDTTGRSNARTLDWSGNETLAGNLVLGGTNSDITLSGSGNTWDGTNTSLKAAIAAASGGGSISDFTPPTTQAAGVHGLVPAPAILEDADNKLFLLSDGTWEFKGHYEDTQMKEENVPLNFYIDGNGDPVVVETWKPQYKVVEVDLDAGGISYDLLSNDNYQTQRGLTPNEYISEFTNKNIHLEVESGDAYAINKYHIPTGENSVSMDIDAGDINLSSTWDGTNTSLKTAIASLSSRITALGG